MWVLEVVENVGFCGFDLQIIFCVGLYYIDNGVEWFEGLFDICKVVDVIFFGVIGHIGSDGKPVRRADGELVGYEQVIGICMKLDFYVNMWFIKFFDGVYYLIFGIF